MIYTEKTKTKENFRLNIATRNSTIIRPSSSQFETKP